MVIQHVKNRAHYPVPDSRGAGAYNRQMSSSEQTIRARVISNPVAGGASSSGRERREALRAACGRLLELGWTVSWRTTEYPGHARELALHAAHEGEHVVVAAGGDGTINEIVNGLIGTETALAVLPFGTANVLAAQLGLVGVPSTLYRPKLVKAAESLHAGRIALVDTGLARSDDGVERSFLLWAGIGLDAAVAHEVEGMNREFKRLLGPAAYGAIGLKQTALGGGGAAATIEIDGDRIENTLYLGVVANIPLYGGAVHLAPYAVLDDGMLDVALFCGENLLSAFQHFLGEDVRTAVQHLGAVLTGRTADERPVAQPAQVVRIEAEPNLPVHLDGEPFGTSPVTFTVQPGSLRLLVPPCAPESLLSAEGVE